MCHFTWFPCWRWVSPNGGKEVFLIKNDILHVHIHISKYWFHKQMAIYVSQKHDNIIMRDFFTNDIRTTITTVSDTINNYRFEKYELPQAAIHIFSVRLTYHHMSQQQWSAAVPTLRLWFTQLYLSFTMVEPYNFAVIHHSEIVWLNRCKCEIWKFGVGFVQGHLIHTMRYY